MPRGLAITINALIPGSILLYRGRLALGLILVSLATMVISVMCAGHFLSRPDGQVISGYANCAYLFIAAIASIGLWWYDRPQITNALTIRQLYQTSAAAWLRDEHDAALRAASALVKHAPNEAGAWHLLAMTAKSVGNHRIATRASQRAHILEQEIS